jgi:hypothetical protein
MDTYSGPGDVSNLRGAEARQFSRTFWTIAGAILCVVLAVVITVGFLSAARDNARIERLKSHGVLVTVTVSNCVGNIGGSGSNAAGFTCRGTYQVGGVRYREVIGSKTTFSSSGSLVRGVADPVRPSTIELASAVKASSTSASKYIVPSLLTLLLGALAFRMIRARTL